MVFSGSLSEAHKSSCKATWLSQASITVSECTSNELQTGYFNDLQWTASSFACPFHIFLSNLTITTCHSPSHLWKIPSHLPSRPNPAHLIGMPYKSLAALPGELLRTVNWKSTLTASGQSRNSESRRMPRLPNPWRIEWDLSNGPLSKLLELLDTQVEGSVQGILLEISWTKVNTTWTWCTYHWCSPSYIQKKQWRFSRFWLQTCRLTCTETKKNSTYCWWKKSCTSWDV